MGFELPLVGGAIFIGVILRCFILLRRDLI